MRKIISMILALTLVLGFSGCSDVEIEHFDKAMNSQLTDKYTIDESVSIVIDPENFGKAVMDISKRLEEVSRTAESAETDEVLPEPSDAEADEFLDEFISEIRVALNENKILDFEINVKGGVDYDSMNADEMLTCRINNITLDAGNISMRGDKVYLSKKTLYTVGSIGYIDDFEGLKTYYTALDELFGDKEYIVMSYGNLGGALGEQNFASSLIESTDVLQKAQLDSYAQAKEILKDFDSGCVKRIENGTRFELKSENFANTTNRAASYIRQHCEDSASLVNGYMSMVNGFTESLYGDVTGMTDMYNYTYTGEDIMNAMDAIKMAVNTPEFDIIFNTLGITITNDITGDSDNQNNVTTFKCTYNNKSAFELKSVSNITKADSYEFIKIDDTKALKFEDISENLNEVQKDLIYGDYSLYDNYTCPECGETFKYIDSRYCNECGFVHDFYEGDANCDKQPGCELANGVSVA